MGCWAPTSSSYLMPLASGAIDVELGDTASVSADQVLGGGSYHFGFFGVDAQGNGDSAQGAFSFDQNGWPSSSTGWAEETARITCLSIDGTSATVTGKVTSGSDQETVVCPGELQHNQSQGLRGIGNFEGVSGMRYGQREVEAVRWGHRDRILTRTPESRPGASGDGEHAFERHLGPFRRLDVDRDRIAHLALDESLENPGQMLRIDPRHGRTGAHEGIEADDSLVG